MITRKQEIEELVRRSCRGITNMINRWMLKSPIFGLLVISIPEKDLIRERPRGISQIIMTAEDCVLFLTERKVGSCWLGAINRNEVRDFMRLDKEKVTPLMICMGHPKQRTKSPDVDYLLYRSLSRKRKPLSSIAHDGIYGKPYAVQDLKVSSITPAARQDVESLLQSMYNQDYQVCDASLELIIESCLEAARIAPSAGNQQEWNFIVVTETKTIEKVREACGGRHSWRAAIIGSAPETGLESLLLDRPFWVIDLSIAFSHMTLMAASMNCAHELCVQDIDEVTVGKLAGLPSKIRTLGVLGIL